ncbi:MAG: Smr/MutS family protein, partial [Myxococcota bacterium]
GFNAPFRDLDKRLKKNKPSEAPPAGGRGKGESGAGHSGSPETPAVDDAALFDEAMAGVTPLGNRDNRRAPASGKAPSGEPADPDATLAKLVSGDVPFDIADTEEYVEGHVAGFDHHVLRKLRRGEYAVQAHLDLHHMSRQEARAAVERFVTRSLVAGHRCVLIVHGRGHHSPDRIPVLKNVLRAWLSRGRIGRAVLAFTSAQPVDGGAGAIYVLLRRRR